MKRKQEEKYQKNLGKINQALAAMADETVEVVSVEFLYMGKEKLYESALE